MPVRGTFKTEWGERMSFSGPDGKTYRKFDAKRAADFAMIANEVFAPVYPVIAGQILERCQVREGLCLDLVAARPIFPSPLPGTRR